MKAVFQETNIIFEKTTLLIIPVVASFKFWWAFQVLDNLNHEYNVTNVNECNECNECNERMNECNEYNKISFYYIHHFPLNSLFDFT